MKKIIVTGSAGFIGFHLSKLLLENGFKVLGVDNFTDYYDVNLKKTRNDQLQAYENFSLLKINIEDESFILKASEFNPHYIVHLAAQAGVRYSLENPRTYINTNIIGTFNIMEVSRISKVKHLLMASTSSVYGASTDMPFNEKTSTDHPLTIYAATKKANESMAHSYSHLWKIPTTMFRFFTVYGPWGRPDLALFKFVNLILQEKEIDIYNDGEMYRDFTYIDDLTKSILLLISCEPINSIDKNISLIENDNISEIAPFRIVNIGNSNKVKLLDFVDAIEEELSIKAKRNYMPIQKGDVPATWADATLLFNLTGFKPNTDIKHGISKFIEWFRDYYKV
tara:strand:- start:6037 stop:7050 length:1014 start_codon:yes stop_codon:yes gene_type:complete